jgi:transcriptional regulator GlxA family with amidase domain
LARSTKKRAKTTDARKVSPTEIGLVLYPNAQQSAISGLFDLFQIADQLSRKRLGTDKALLRISQLSEAKRGDFLARTFDTHPNAGGEPAVLVLPPSLETPSAKLISPAVTNYLRTRHKAGAILASVCAGAFVLAETGLLSGRVVTTHWVHADAFRNRFRDVKVDSDKLIIDDGDIITAGGLMAWTDLGLRIVDRFLGPTAMLETARYMLVDPPGREQRYYSIFAPHLTHGNAAILRVQHWLQKADVADVSISDMAKRAGLEERTFLRHFKRATGLTPIEYTQHLRVGRAREMLETTTQSIDEIAWLSGYGDPGAFRKVFVRIMGLTPSDYRHRFGQFHRA